MGRDRPFWLRSPVARRAPRVEGALLAAAGRVGVPVSWVRDESTGNSDHREFELLGLPGAKLGVGAGGEPCRHMPCDRPSRLDPTSLVLARRMVAEALHWLARRRLSIASSSSSTVCSSVAGAITVIRSQRSPCTSVELRWKRPCASSRSRICTCSSGSRP